MTITELLARVAELRPKMTPGQITEMLASARFDRLKHLDLDDWRVDAPNNASWEFIGQTKTDPAFVVVQNAKRGFDDRLFDARKAFLLASPDIFALAAAAIALLPDLMDALAEVAHERDEALELADTQIAGHGETMRALVAVPVSK